MAKATEPTEKKKGKGANVVVWGLMGLLMLGLGGFGVTNFGGGVTAIGSVGKREIETNDYARALQQELNAISAQFGTQISLQQAQALGLDRQVRQKLINTAALDNETARIGVSAGDALVAKEITAMSSFSGTAGSFDRDTYRRMLDQNNLTETAFEKRLREDLVRALLQGAVGGGFGAPAPVIDTLYGYISERRSFSLLELTEADLVTLPNDPTDDDLSTYYQAHIADFTNPEARRITYAALLPEDIAGKMTVDEASLRQLYEDRKAEFQQPERRLVERLVFADDAAALAAKARLDSGSRFEDLVAERGLKLDDIDLGDRAEAELGAAGAAVFALTEPGVVGPLPSDLGPALFRMNGILAAQNTSFEDATTDLSAELATDAARRAIDDQIEALDDRLAGGATLEDLAKETDMQLATLDFSAQTKEGIAGYPGFRTAAEAAQIGDFPEIVTLEDGGIFALRLDEIVPPTPVPLDEAKEKVTAAWRKAELAKALLARATEIKSEIESGAGLGAYGIVDVAAGLARSSSVEGAPADLIKVVFDMEAGQTRVVEDGTAVVIVTLEAITPGDVAGEEATALKAALSAQVEQALGQDAFQLFTNALTSSAGITLNDTAIAAVHSQFR